METPLLAHCCTARPMTDRLLIAAVVDRLIFGDETTFRGEDARELARLLPRDVRSSFLGRFFGIGADISVSGGSTRGRAAGVGDVEVSDDKPRRVNLATGERGAVRAGQWRL